MNIKWTYSAPPPRTYTPAKEMQFSIIKEKYLGIWSAISSKLSDGLIGVLSNNRDGAKVKWPVESLTHRNTRPPRRCRWRSADFFRLFSCSRCRLCRRKKNMDILCVTVYIVSYYPSLFSKASSNKIRLAYLLWTLNEHPYSIIKKASKKQELVKQWNETIKHFCSKCMLRDSCCDSC